MNTLLIIIITAIIVAMVMYICYLDWLIKELEKEKDWEREINNK